MSPASAVCPAAALTALALAAIVPRASCFARNLHDAGAGYPVVTFTVDGDLTCAGALVSSKDVLTTAACAESLANDGKTKALLGDKTAPVLCHNMNSERALALVRLGDPMCDEANPRSMFTPAQVAPVPATPTADGCLMLYPQYNAAKEILVLPQTVAVVECPAEGSKPSIETKGSEKAVCVNFSNPGDIPLIGGLVLTCRPDEASAPPVVGLLPARGTAGEAPVLESAVNVDKQDTKFWELSGTADCSAPKPTPFPCESTASSTEAALTTPTTMSTATDTPTATTATATATTATATATGSSTASPADPATAGTQTPSPSGSPGLMAPPAPLLVLAAARALTLLARRLG